MPKMFSSPEAIAEDIIRDVGTELVGGLALGLGKTNHGVKGLYSRAGAEGRASFKLVGQVNSELPFMPGAGDLPGDEFSAVLESPETEFPLFAPPSEPVTD